MAPTGQAFELQVYGILRRLLAERKLGLAAESCKILHHPHYFSRDRKKNITVDISIEVYMGDATQPSIIWVWECKDYSHSVPVDDVEEFHSKLDQIGSDRTKGTIISRGCFQQSAIEFATAKGIGIARLSVDNQIDTVRYYGGPPKELLDMFEQPEGVLMLLCEAPGQWDRIVANADRRFCAVTTSHTIAPAGNFDAYVLSELCSWANPRQAKGSDACTQGSSFPSSLQSYSGSVNAGKACQRGLAFETLHNPEQALKWYEYALRLDNTHVEAWSCKGLLLERDNHYKDAIDCFDRAINNSPKPAEQARIIAVVLEEIGHREQALLLFDRALAHDGNCLQALVSKGRLISETSSNWREALVCYDQALTIDSNREDIWYRRGVALGCMSQWSEALQSFDRALALKPSGQATLIQKCVALQQLRRFSEALDCANQAITLNPGLASAWLHKGRLLAQHMSDCEEAERCLATADRLGVPANPESVDAWLDAADSFRKLGRSDQALLSCDRAIRADSQSAQPWFIRGCVLSTDLHDYPNALTSFREAARRGHKEAAEAARQCEGHLTSTIQPNFLRRFWLFRR